MSFVAESRLRTRPVLPLAGMVDVLFLLLIFFMTASVFREQELQIPVELPATETAQVAAPDPATRIVVTVTADGRIFLGEREVSADELKVMFRELADQFPHESVIVRGDRDSRFGLAVHVMDLAQQAGIRDVSVATIKTLDETDEPSGP